MKRSWKTILLAAAFVAIAQAAGAQALPQPPAGCQISLVNGMKAWGCALGTFATPPPPPPIAGFIIYPGYPGVPAGGSYAVVTSLSVVFTSNSTHQTSTVSLKSDLGANVPQYLNDPAAIRNPGLLLATTPMNVVGLFHGGGSQSPPLGSALTVSISAGNGQSLVQAMQSNMATGGNGLATGISGAYTVYELADGVWKKSPSHPFTFYSLQMPARQGLWTLILD